MDRCSTDQKSIDPSWTPVKTAYAMTQQSSLLAMSGDFSDTFALKAGLTDTLRYGAAAAYGVAGGVGRQRPPADMGAAFPVDAMRFYQMDAAVRQRLEAHTNGLRFLYTAPVIVGVSALGSAAQAGIAKTAHDGYGSCRYYDATTTKNVFVQFVDPKLADAMAAMGGKEVAGVGDRGTWLAGSIFVQKSGKAAQVGLYLSAASMKTMEPAEADLAKVAAGHM